MKNQLPTRHRPIFGTVVRIASLFGVMFCAVAFPLSVSADPPDTDHTSGVYVDCVGDDGAGGWLELLGLVEVESPSNPVANAPEFLLFWSADLQSPVSYQSDGRFATAEYERGLLTASLPVLDGSFQPAGHAAISARLVQVPGQHNVLNRVDRQGNLVWVYHINDHFMVADVTIILPGGQVLRPGVCEGFEFRTRAVANHPR